jgi:hypothetical protein
MSPRPFAHRPAAPRCRGGASSLLRLSNPAPGRWPSASEFGDWIARSARQGTVQAEAAHVPMQARTPGAASPWFTRLWPTAA